MKNDCHLVLSHDGDERQSVLCFDREVPIRDGTQNRGRRYMGLCFDFDDITEDGVRTGNHRNMKGAGPEFLAGVLHVKRDVEARDDGTEAVLLVGPIPA